MLGPVLLSTFISNVGEGAERTLSRFAVQQKAVKVKGLKHLSHGSQSTESQRVHI